jgi:hypothetical protein
MDTTETKTRLETQREPARGALARLDFTALVLAPRWRLGRRAAGKRAVAAALEQARPLARRVTVACHAVAAPSLRELGADEVFIVPDTESTLSMVQYALEACPDDPLLIAPAGCEIRRDAVLAMLAAVRDEGAAVSAAVDRRGLLEFPIACRPALRPVVTGCLYMGQESLADLLRRPCARLVTLD